MKKHFAMILTIFFIFSCGSRAFASNPINKLARGIVNIPTSLVEIPKAPLKGIARMAGRIFVGIYDIVTFPFPLPRYYAPLTDPEFAFDSMPYSFKIYNKGVISMDRGQYRRAVALFSEVLKIDPANAQAFYYRGKAYERLDEYRKSIDDLNAAESLGFHPELEHIKTGDIY